LVLSYNYDVDHGINNQNIYLTKEFDILSNKLLDARDISIYKDILKLWNLLEDQRLKEIIKNTQPDEVKKDLAKLSEIGQKTCQKLTEYVDFFIKNVSKGHFSRELFVYLENIEKLKESFFVDDIYFPEIYERSVKEFFLAYIKERKLEKDYEDWFSEKFMTGEVDFVYGEEYPPYKFSWKRNLLEFDEYTKLLNRIVNQESTSPWYNFNYLDNLVCILRKDFEKYEFPIGFEQNFFPNFSIEKGEFAKNYTLVEVKSAWLCIASFLEKVFKNEMDTIVIKFSEVGQLIFPDGRVCTIGKKDPEYSFVSRLANGERSVNLEEILSYNDSDIRNEFAKNLRKKMGLSSTQLINKKGFLSIMGVDIVKV